MALGCLNKSIAGYTKVFGDEHPYVATAYDHLGTTYCELGDYEKALEYHNKALSIKIMVFGEGHPYLAKTYINICDAYLDEGNYAKALENAQNALRVIIPVFGEDHLHAVSVKEKIAKIESEMKGKKNE